MRSKSIVIVTVLFSIMLIGIIAIQAWWIRRSLQLDAQQFDAATYRALQSAVKQYDQKEEFNFIQNEADFDSVIQVPGPGNKKIKIHHHIPDISNYQTVDLTDQICVVSTRGRTIVRIISNDCENSITSQDIKVTENKEDTGTAAKYVHKKIKDIDTLVQEMIQIKNPDSLFLKPVDIEMFIGCQFIQNNLPDSFHFALLKPHGDYIFKSREFHDTAGCYKVNLYPNDLFGRKILLLVDIPGKLLRIHYSIWWVFMLSLLFIASLLLLFIYSIQMLIRHKNLLEAKNDFINHMSHEIKTPLAGISLGADMLIQKNDKMSTEQIAKVAHSIKEQSSRLDKDMSAVLLNAMVNEAPEVKFTPFNIVEAINESIEECRLIFINKTVKIETDFAKDTLMINGNKALWHKVFCNLLDNSVKFSNHEVVIKIQVSLQSSGNILIGFSDNGIGIGKEGLPLIFEKFYRSDYYKQSNIKGFGLGLNFVKKVVQLHDGSVKAESEPGKGTTIQIEIPISHE